MDPAPDVHVYFSTTFDAEHSRVDIGTCKCRVNNAVYISNAGQQPSRMTVRCANKQHLWRDVKVLPVLYSLNTKGDAKPSMVTVKNAINSWLEIAPHQQERVETADNEVEESGPSHGGGVLAGEILRPDIVMKVIEVQQHNNDLQGRMERLQTSEPRRDVVIIPTLSPRAIGSQAGSVEGTIEGQIPAPDCAVGGLEAGLTEASAQDSPEADASDNQDDSLGWVFFIVMNVRAIRVTAANLKRLADLIVQYGIPVGINALMLWQAWNDGDGLRFARALEPLAQLLWPQAWLEKYVMRPVVARSLKAMLSAHAAYTQLSMLQTMLQQRTVTPIAPGIPPVDAESAVAQRALHSAIKTRTVLEAKSVAREKGTRSEGVWYKKC